MPHKKSRSSGKAKSRKTSKKVKDSNLFMTKSGKMVRLADICTPSIHSKNKLLAEDIIKYSQEYILNRPLKYKSLAKPDRDTLDILLIEQYLFKRFTDFNMEFLKRGFGSYKKNGYTHSDPEYLKAELEAKKITKVSGKPNIKNELSHVVVIGIFGGSNIDFGESYKLSYRIFKNRQIGNVSLNFGGCCYILKVKLFLGKKFISFNPGFIFFTNLMQDIGSPTIGFDIGLLNKVYLYIDSIIYLQIVNYGITYKFINPYNEICLEKNFKNVFNYTLRLKNKVTKSFLIDAELNYDIKKRDTTYFLGLGILFGN